MLTAVYPGSFDPVTFGHLDVIKRASRIADKLIVGILKNKNKTPLFSVRERVTMVEKFTGDYDNVKVEAFDGMLVDFARRENARIIIRGVRDASDFEYETRMSLTNRRLDSGIETLFIAADPEYSYISSTVVREVAGLGGDVRKFVPGFVAGMLLSKMKEKRSAEEA